MIFAKEVLNRRCMKSNFFIKFINRFIYNIEKWPNILLKSCGVSFKDPELLIAPVIKKN